MRTDPLTTVRAPARADDHHPHRGPATGPGPLTGPAPTDSRSWPMLAALLLGQFMAILDVYIANVAVPSIGTDLHASGAGLQLVIGGYTVAYAMMLITGARLGAVYGRRRVFHTGVVGFTAASLACGLAPGIAVLVAARVVQGAFAAMMVPQGVSLIQIRMTGAARARAFSAYTAMLCVGSIVGLVVGGVLVDADLFGAGWRPVFLVNLPVGAALTALVPRLIPADAPTGPVAGGTSGGRRLDLPGLAVAVLAVVLVELPLVVGREVGWPVWTYGCVATGFVLAGLFVAVERRVVARGGNPLLDLEVLRRPGMAVGLASLLAAMVAYGGLLFCTALHLQAGLGDTALRAALTLIPFGLAFGLVSYFWRALPSRVHPLLTTIGLALCTVSAVCLAAAFHGGGQSGPAMWLGFVGFGAGLGCTSTLLTHSLVHVRPTHAADASGLLTTTMQLGQLTGVAVLGSVFLGLSGPLRSGVPGRALSSAHALATTLYWLVPLTLVGAVFGLAVARVVAAARRAARAAAADDQGMS